MQIISEVLMCLKISKEEKRPLGQLLWAKRWFWLQKFSEYPMQAYYLQLSGFQL